MAKKNKRIVSKNSADRTNDSYFMWIMDRAINKSFLITKKTLQKISNAPRKNQKKTIAFVSGFQRSGTNLVMDILEKSLQTEVFHEVDYRAFDNYELRSNETLKYLVNTSSGHIVIFKALLEAHRLSALLHEFQEAKAIWVYRDFRDVVHSHVRRWNGAPGWISEIASETGTADWRGRNISAETLSILRQYRDQDLSNETATALFWYLRNILFFEQNFPKNPRVLLVRYSSILTDTETTLRRIFSFLGLNYSSRFTQIVSTLPLNKKPTLRIDNNVTSLCENLQKRLDSEFSKETKF